MATLLDRVFRLWLEALGDRAAASRDRSQAAWAARQMATVGAAVGKPVFFLVDDEEDVPEARAGDLRRRFGTGYRLRRWRPGPRGRC